MTPRDGALPDPTCNTACRRAYATLLRAFLTGRCNTDEYDHGRCAIVAERGYDNACEDIHAVVWSWYSDLREHHLDRVFRRTDATRRFGARAILFLHTDERYESPVAPSFVSLLKPLTVLPLVAAVCVGLWIASPLVLAALTAALLVVSIRTVFGRGVEWRPGLFARLDRADVFEHWPFHDADRIAAATARQIWLAG